MHLENAHISKFCDLGDFLECLTQDAQVNETLLMMFIQTSHLIQAKF